MLFVIIRTATDGSTVTLHTCRSREAAIVAAQLEKEKVPLQERTSITAVCLDDGGYTEIML